LETSEQIGAASKEGGDVQVNSRRIRSGPESPDWRLIAMNVGPRNEKRSSMTALKGIQYCRFKERRKGKECSDSQRGRILDNPNGTTGLPRAGKCVGNNVSASPLTAELVTQKLTCVAFGNGEFDQNGRHYDSFGFEKKPTSETLTNVS
jgi:hypothetical protein